jgi:hypothetical protein
LAGVLALIFSVFFSLSLILTVLVGNLGGILLNPGTYKNALSELGLYDQLPAIIGSTITAVSEHDPCVGNPVACEDIRPELRDCYKQVFSDERYRALSSGQDLPTAEDQLLIQSCKDRFNEVVPADQAEEGQTGSEGMPAYFKNLSSNEWESILRIVLPPDRLESMSVALIDDLFAYLNSDIDRVVLSLKDLKENMMSSEGVDLIRQIILSQPPCTDGELEQLQNMSKPEDLILCNPPEDLLLLILPFLHQQLKSAVMGLPDEVQVVPSATSIASTSTDSTAVIDPLGILRRVRFYMHLSGLIPLVFLLLVTLLRVRALSEWMRWWGVPSFFTGLTILGFGLTIAQTQGVIWIKSIEPGLPSYIPDNLASLIRDFLQFFAHSYSERVVVQGLVLTVFALLLWIGSYLLKKKIDG